MNSGKLQQRGLCALLAFYFAVQLIYVVFFPLPFENDSLEHYRLAQECLAAGRCYPLPQHRFSDYILAPVYINFLIGLLALHNSPATILFANLVLNALQLFLLYRLARKILERKHWARLVVVLYVLYLTNLGLVLHNLTELLFGVLCLASLNLYLHRSWRAAVLAGVSLALAIGVRPFGWALLLACFTVEVPGLLRRRQWRAPILGLAGSAFAVLAVLGGLGERAVGEFVFTSTTGPANLLMGANDLANGAYNKRVFAAGQPGELAADSAMTFVAKGDFWTAQALRWIRAHPLKWLALLPRKLFHLFARDDWAINALTHSHAWNLYRIGKMLQAGSFHEILAGESLCFKAGFLVLQCVHHICYFFLLALVLCQAVQVLTSKSAFWRERFAVLYLFSLFGLAMNLLTVGDPRYKYPYFILWLVTIPPALRALGAKRHGRGATTAGASPPAGKSV
ncbi:MAG: hypothetical protein ONB48_15370 [candidate division KSB1 bacterium]|nr:hypothetical protein [candidate division KSB1 bacterium]MDZ7276195.1 hypothetical protein [candidate division KSB1 bacterium]MDZ7287025.1 hypothetical protein [candidate division KSB1 bacterium]MDZ7297050.1 hypothetical protein [candidate division KSB1 bacterium]MDZ7307189.1 hypothetical protein [candidate division KSB1 bacterium]